MMQTPIVAALFGADATQRRLILGVIVATLLAVALVAADLARGGRPDPPALRAAATLLDGAWKFHAGDDSAWASSTLDDGAWQTIDMTAPPGSHDRDVGLPDYVNGWMAHGHAGYTGYAWYRREVNVPATPAAWDILGPSAVEDGYELYWNGTLLGGSGRLGANPRVVNTRPLLFALPADAAGTRGVLALRVFMLARGGPPSTTDGGMRSPPILAPRPSSAALHDAHWQRTVAGYVVDAVEPLAMLLVVGLALACSRRGSRRPFLSFAGVALVLMAARRLENATVSWTDLLDLPTYSWLARYLGPPAIAAWALAWNRWSLRPWRAVDIAAGVLLLAAIGGSVTHSSTLAAIGRLGSLALFAVLIARVAYSGPLRVFATLVLVLITLALFGGDLLDPLGIPGIWFPFGIGVSRTQYLYALLIPLLAILIARTCGRTVPAPLDETRRTV